MIGVAVSSTEREEGKGSQCERLEGRWLGDKNAPCSYKFCCYSGKGSKSGGAVPLVAVW